MYNFDYVQLQSTCTVYMYNFDYQNHFINALQFLQEGARIQAQLTLSLTTLAKTKEKYEKVSVSNVNN